LREVIGPISGNSHELSKIFGRPTEAEASDCGEGYRVLNGAGEINEKKKERLTLNRHIN
jgi:hypothetical protein